MENQSHFFRVGLFILAVLGFFVFISIKYFGTQTVKYNQYAILFQKDVGGLKLGSDVTLQGIKVGQVTDINLLDDDITVQIIIEVEERFLVREDTVANLAITGISGAVRVQLENKGFSEEKLEAGPFQKRPTIPSDSSTVEQMFDQLPAILTSVNNIAEQTERMFSEENVKNISETFYNINLLSQDLRRQQGELDKLLASLDIILKNAGKASENLPALIEGLGQSLGQIQSSLSAINNRVLPDLENTINTGRNSLETINSLGSKLSDNPSSIIKEPEYKGYSIVE